MKNIPLFAMMLILLAGCQKPPAEQAVCVEEPPVNVIVQTVEPDTLVDYVEISGKLEAQTDVRMLSETQGKIRSVHKQLGDYVKVGEAIGETDNDVILIQLEQAEAALVSAELGVETAQLNLQAAEKLFAEEKISQAEYDQAKIAHKSAQAQMKMAKASLESAQKAVDNSLLLAPTDGYIAELNIAEGEYLAPGQPVCTIIDYDQLKIMAGIGESQIFHLEKGQPVSIVSPRYPQPFIGEIVGIGRKPLNETGLYPIEIEVENSNHELLPGMVVSAQIFSRQYNDILFISLNNLIREYDNYFAYIANAENRAEKRYVSIQEIIRYNAIIESGIEPGERLIVDGLDSVVDGMQVNIRKGLE